MKPPLASLIVPVFNGGEAFRTVLSAISRSSFRDYELIVVDDGSTDGSSDLARQAGGTVVRTSRPQSGPAAARNLGVSVARGEYVFFVDADCEVHPDAIGLMVDALNRIPEIDAIFGSYDDTPAARNFVAQYKNLFHHFIHQTSDPEATTFWGGCGGIRRSVFLAVGGFDAEAFPRPSIEDIELGSRLRRAGKRIRLDRDVWVKHHKAWNLAGLIRTDVRDRGIPWTRLMLSHRDMEPDLNLRWHHRLSAILLVSMVMLLVASIAWPVLAAGAVAVALGVFGLNLDLYRFFYLKRGLWFTIRAIPMHWLYYLYSVFAFGCGVLLHFASRISISAPSGSAPERR